MKEERKKTSNEPFKKITGLQTYRLVEQMEESVIITNPDGVIEYVNPAFEMMTGYCREEALGRTPRIIKSGRQGEKFYEQLWKTISSGHIFRGVLINRRKDGSLYYEQKTITPLKDALGRITQYGSTGKDITGQIRGEEERARLVTILEATTDLVAIITPQGRMRYINRAGEKMLGFAEKVDPSKINLPDLAPEWARCRMRDEGIPAAIRDGVWSGETAFIDHAGLEIPVSQVILAHRTPSGEVEYLSTIARDISDRRAQILTLEYQATHDPLTGLPNRALFFDRLNYALVAARREKESFALLFADLNRFKEINDTLGHHIGDLLLKQIGWRLRGTLRLSDTVARMGGDEFALILPAVGSQGGILAARKILEAIELPFVLEGISLSTAASIGIALYPDHGTDAGILMHRADRAMYVAKEARSGYAVYQSRMELPHAI
jgi:diguanylate cyclase (GGDEF)-like protein/PAS domain S-box-containing protein